MKIISHKKGIQNDTLYDEENITITLTCQSGLESLVRRESERLGIRELSVQDRLISGKGSLDTLYSLLIGSRFANRVYIEILKKNITDFDTLYETLRGIRWNDYITGREQIIIEASSTRSLLTSIPSIQSVSQKAIYSTLYTPNISDATEVHILILIIDDIARILLDITGNPLHKRGYRKVGGEAPMKENLASALIAFSGWRYRDPLWDPFCGSGTIAIEAVLLARNIPPGLNRKFRIESLPFHKREKFIAMKDRAKRAIYPSGNYTVFASDIDPNMIDIAKENAKNAGVIEDIIFHVDDFLSQSEYSRGSLIVTNPPYGMRIRQNNLDKIYKKLFDEIEVRGGGCITNYPMDTNINLANRKIMNGNEECRFYYKKKSS